MQEWFPKEIGEGSGLCGGLFGLSVPESGHKEAEGNDEGL